VGDFHRVILSPFCILIIYIFFYACLLVLITTVCGGYVFRLVLVKVVKTEPLKENRGFIEPGKKPENRSKAR